MLNALQLIVLPTMEVTNCVPSVPLGSIAMMRAPETNAGTSPSTVIEVVVADIIRPLIRCPARVGSLMRTTAPGRIVTPASIEAVKLQTSPS